MRWHRRVLWGVLIAWGAWLVLGNIFLLPGVGPNLVTRRPERSRITWARAWTVVPFVAHVRGFSCGGHVRNRRWRVEVDRGRVVVNLAALPLRTFHGMWPRASGVRVHLEHTDQFMPRRKKTRPGFRIMLTGAVVDGIGSMQLGDVTVDGLRSARGSFSTRARGPLEVPRAVVRMRAGRVTLADDVLADELDLDADARLARHVPRDHRDTGPLPFVSGRIDVSGRLGDLSLLERFLKNTPMLEFEGGGARLAGGFEIDEGALVDPTEFTVSDATYTVRYLDSVVASGTGRIVGGRHADDGEALRFELDDYRLSRPGSEDEYARGEELTVRILADDIDLRRVGSAVALAVDVPDAELLDLAAFDSFLPERAGLDLIGGHGSLSSRLLLDLRTDDGSASLHLDCDDVRAELQGRAVEGDLEIRSELLAVEARRRLFRIRELEVDLDDVAVEGERRHRSTGGTGGWWGRFRIDQGTLRLAKPLEVDAPITIEALDARPLLAIAGDRSKAAAWADRLIRTDDLRGSGRLETGDGPVRVGQLALSAGDAEVDGELCLEKGRPAMLLLLSLDGRHVGLERGPAGGDWRFKTPVRWFGDRRPGFRCPAGD